ncbi:DivIVA domain-containing protein [Kocuria sp. LUK]|uniref:DivIVA domain-containing protein n=1 Tax=Kocuria sp. LUK TaxID=2897828 RepID=UPI001E584EDE|nr:DivIVA domain-containing protein [Kocuria sp. LUK]MCD1144118.1 DivIVA domain-containing protein [Kocuria sp. LUK]
MALSPEDVINKRFQPTKFREGYDQDEVDDFLDEIVVELRRLNQANADLEKQLEAAGHPVAPKGTGPAAAPAEEQPGPAEGTSAAPAAGVEETPAAAVAAGPAAGPATAAPDAAQSAAGVLAMAQKLHDDYVAEGTAERDRLVAEGRAQAEELVEDARRTREQTLSVLEQEQSELEARVAGLRDFEQRYRTGLKGYIQDQLRDLDATPSPEPEPSAEVPADRA